MISQIPSTSLEDFSKNFMQRKCDIITEQKSNLCYNKATIRKGGLYNVCNSYQ